MNGRFWHPDVWRSTFAGEAEAAFMGERKNMPQSLLVTGMNGK